MSSYERYLADVGNQDQRFAQSQQWINEYVGNQENLADAKTKIEENLQLLKGRQVGDIVEGLMATTQGTKAAFDVAKSLKNSKSIGDFIHNKIRNMRAKKQNNQQEANDEEPTNDDPSGIEMTDIEPTGGANQDVYNPEEGIVDRNDEAPEEATAEGEGTEMTDMSVPFPEARGIDTSGYDTSEGANIGRASDDAQPAELQEVDEEASQATSEVSATVGSEASEAGSLLSSALGSIGTGLAVGADLASVGLTIYEGVELNKDISAEDKAEATIQKSQDVLSSFQRPIIGFGGIAESPFDTSLDGSSPITHF